MQSFSRCIHFLKASCYADLGTVIKYWWIADPSACKDCYFRPAWNYFNFRNMNKSHRARSREYGRWGKTVTFSLLKNSVPISEAWAGTLSCRKWICLKPVTGSRFWWYFCRLHQYYVFVVLSGDVFALFHRHFYCDSFAREENCIPNLPCTQKPFGNYWASAMFRGKTFIANFSGGLRIIDPIFITCDDIGKLLFDTSLKHLKQLFGHFNPLSVLLISQQMLHPSSKNL